MTREHVHLRANQRKREQRGDNHQLPPVVAAGRLKEARRWFEICGWHEVPRNDRGWKILQWGADHAWMASSKDPVGSVRRWCRRVAPSLSDTEMSEILDYVATSNKLWTHDQSATVLELSLDDCKAHGFRFLGANDDLNFERRLTINRQKDATRKRKERAERSTGRPRGRPRLQLTVEERLLHEKELAAQRQQKRRARMSSGRPPGRPKSAKATETPSRKNASSYIDRDICERTDLIVTEFHQSQCAERLKRDGAEYLVDDFEGDDGGYALASPPQRPSAPPPA